jgi:hypothetical protein
MGSNTIEVDFTITLNSVYNFAPDKPARPTGPPGAVVNTEHTFTASTTDPDGDDVLYQWDWGGGDISDWIGPFASGADAEATHTWTDVGSGTLQIKVRAKDTLDAVGEWSQALFIPITEPAFTCGDANSDESVDVSDAVFIINYAFAGGSPPDPIEAGDANCDSSVDVSDAVYIINYAFAGGNAPCDTSGDGEPDC